MIKDYKVNYKLYYHLKRKNITEEELSLSSGVPVTIIRRILRNDSDISVSDLADISKSLGVDLRDMFYCTGWCFVEPVIKKYEGVRNAKMTRSENMLIGDFVRGYIKVRLKDIASKLSWKSDSLHDIIYRERFVLEEDARLLSSLVNIPYDDMLVFFKVRKKRSNDLTLKEEYALWMS